MCYVESGEPDPDALYRDITDRRGNTQDRKNVRTIEVETEFPVVNGDRSVTYYTAEGRNGRRLRAEMSPESLRKESVPLLDRNGVRASVMVPVLIVFALVLLTFFFIGRGRVNAKQRRTSILITRIENVERECEQIREAIDEKTEKLNVGRRAVDLGMMASTSARSVPLWVPENAELTLPDVSLYSQ